MCSVLLITYFFTVVYILNIVNTALKLDLKEIVNQIVIVLSARKSDLFLKLYSPTPGYYRVFSQHEDTSTPAIWFIKYPI